MSSYWYCHVCDARIHDSDHYCARCHPEAAIADETEELQEEIGSLRARAAEVERERDEARAEAERLRAERRELCERVGRSVMAMYEERASYGERVYDEDVAEIARELDEEGGDR